MRGPAAGRCGRSSAARTCSRTTRCSTAPRRGKATRRSCSTTTSAGSPTGRSPTHVRLIPDAEVGVRARVGDGDARSGTCGGSSVRAKRRGGKVVVGGHSLGGTITTAYATWDFGGRPGRARARRPGVHRRRQPPDADRRRRRATQRCGELEAGSPWLTFGGIAAPFTGLFNSTGSLGREARARTRRRSARLRPAAREPHAAGAGDQRAASTATRSTPRPRRPALAAAQAHLGRLAATGDPRGWDDAGELTPLQRFADDVLRLGPAGPRRHRLVPPAAPHDRRRRRRRRATRTRRRRCSGVRAIHGDDLPRRLRMYAFGASLGGARVLDAARALAAQSGIPRGRLVLVDRTRPTRTTTRTPRRPGRTTS